MLYFLGGKTSNAFGQPAFFLAGNRVAMLWCIDSCQNRASAMKFACFSSNEIYPTSRGFSLAWVLAFTKSFACLVCRVVGLFTPREKPLR